MRLTLAAALLASTLRANAQEIIGTKTFLDHVAEEEQKRMVVKSLFQKFNKARVAKRGRGKKNMLGIRKIQGGSVLKNSQPAKIEPSSNVECDPDVGLLSCGLGEYCHASGDSSLGGFCTSAAALNRRYLQEVNEEIETEPETEPEPEPEAEGPADYCDTNSPFFDETCDCSAWSGTTVSSACPIEESYCREDCEDVCYDSVATYTKEGTLQTLTFCYDVKEPVVEQFCYTYTYDESDEAQTCSLSLNGDVCTDCTVTEVEYCTGDGEEEECYYTACFQYNCPCNGVGVGDTCVADENVLYPPSLDTCLERERDLGECLDSGASTNIHHAILGASAVLAAVTIA